MMKVLAIVGPTAAGKSALAVEMAPVIGAEIISVDSTAIYRGMDVGTDKPSPEFRSAVPHHLVDVVEPSATVTVAEYQEWARKAIGEISARGKVPLLAGGSGMYFRAVVDPLEFPPTDPAVRRALEERFAPGAGGSAEAHAVLAESDPLAAQRIEPANRRRTIRALEVIEITGRRFSEFGAAWEDREGIYDLRAAGVERSREEMDRMIDQRVDRQFAGGLVEEAKRLAEAGLRRSATSVQALGYAQVLDYLDGTISLDEAIDLTKRRTRRFARRQLTWFKADPRIKWFHPDSREVREYLREGGAG